MFTPSIATLHRSGSRLMFAVVVLLVVGFLGIVAGEALDSGNSPTFRAGAIKRMVFLGAGVMLGLALAWTPTRSLRRMIPLLYAGSCLLLLLCFIPGLGVEVGGSRRWIAIPIVGIRIQPSEFAKPVVVLALASFLASSRFHRRRILHTTILPGCLVLPPIGLIALEVDLGYTTVLVVCVSMLIFLRGVPLFHVAMHAAAGGAAVALGAWSIPSRRIRIEAFLNLDASAAETGYQQWRSVEALARAPAFQSDPASSTSPPGDSLPFAATDFVLPAIGETWGIALCLLVLLAYLIAMRAGFVIARFAANSFCHLAASGLLLIIFFQAILNLGVGLGLLPVSGLPLPLVSAGGSNLVATSMMLGILWRIRTEALQQYLTGPVPGKTSDLRLVRQFLRER